MNAFAWPITVVAQAVASPSVLSHFLPKTHRPVDQFLNAQEVLCTAMCFQFSSLLFI